MSKKESITGTTAKALLVSEQHPGMILVLQRAAGRDIPGGRIQPGEATEAGMHREVREEIGNVELHDVQKIADATKQVGKHAIHAYEIYVARVTLPENGIELSDEHQGYEWVPLEEFKHLDINQRYKDAVKLGKTVIRGLIPSPVELTSAPQEELFEGIVQTPNPDYDAFMEYQTPPIDVARALGD